MILVTGAAGFIGYHLVEKLCARGETVVGIDNINDYYDPTLKQARLARLARLEKPRTNGSFSFHKIDLCDYDALRKLFTTIKVDKICHLAAQAGVRYSLTDPFAYQKSNSEGFLNMIELARHNGVQNFVYASSSSVYG